MHVVIAGGHGKIALQLTRILADRGDLVRSLIRNPGHEHDVNRAGGVPVLCDLEHAPPAEAADAVRTADAVVFAAGAGPGSGPERKETVDYGAAVKLIEAARSEGVRRYLMVSSVGADPDAAGEDTFAVYLRAKGRADRELAASVLDHTIVRPVSLTDEPGRGLVAIAAEAPGATVPRADVAGVLAECLAAPNTVGATFVLSAGDTPIPEAVAAVRSG